MKYLKILAPLGVFILVGTGSAALLGGYGSITGTADVQAAVSIDRIDDSNGEVDLTRNFDNDFGSGDLDLVNLTDSDGSVLNGSFKLDSDTSNVSVVLSGVDDVALEIEGNQVDSKEVDN